MTRPEDNSGRLLAILLLSLGVSGLAAESPPASLNPLHQWPQWRGPLGTGESPHGNPPVVWSEQQNIRWKISLPGRGLSSPIVWGDRLFLTTAIPSGEVLPLSGAEPLGAHNNVQPTRKLDLKVLSIDRGSGRIMWSKTVKRARPHQGTHETGSWASSSAVTDGETIYAFFGSMGLFALDFSGNLIWDRDLGEMDIFHGHGEGSSPALFEETIVVNWDHQGQSFIIALHKRSGRELWKVNRDEITSWSTPIIVNHGGRHQLIVSATQRVRSYDLESGKSIWEVAGLSRNVVASPVAADGYVYVASSYDHQALLAIDLDRAKNDITNSPAVVWKRTRNTPYVPSPLLLGEALFFLRHTQAILTGVRAKSGETLLGPVRLPGSRSGFASPVGAAAKIYIASREGSTAVLQNGGEFALLASNRLDDSFSASPAIAGDSLFLRGSEFLYCIGPVASPGAP